MGQWNRDTYGPISEGVTGSDGGGGRLMSVGVVMLKVPEVMKAEQSRGSVYLVCLLGERYLWGGLLSTYPGVSILLAVAYETYMRKPTHLRDVKQSSASSQLSAVPCQRSVRHSSKQ